MKYKVGDRVRIKSLDWYNENKDEYGSVSCPPYEFFAIMCHHCGTIRTISSVDNFAKKYKMTEDGGHFDWTDEMIEGLVEEETLIERVDDNGLPFNEWLSHKGAFHIPDGYELKDENGNVINATKIVLEKKTKYPKTYQECCKMLYYAYEQGITMRGVTEKEEELFRRLIVLKRCRDAYWKIAGEEMELGKPWEPDYSGTFEHGSPIKYVIYNIGTHIVKERKSSPNHILSFPTEEMRDAFYENFKELIESCKELL